MTARLTAGIAVALLGALAAPAAPLAFDISYPATLAGGPIDGHIVLVISRDASREPRFLLTEGTDSQQGFGVDVEAWMPGRPVRIDSAAAGFPLASPSALPPGDYYVQAVCNLYDTYHLGNGKTVKLPPDRGEGQHWQIKPGNLLTKVVKLHLVGASSGTIRLAFDHKVPALEDELADVDSFLDWRTITHPESPADNAWVKHVWMRSERLSRFWGRPVEIGAVVLLPDGWAAHPRARYPELILEEHYHRHFFPGFRTAPPDVGEAPGEQASEQPGDGTTVEVDKESEQQEAGWKLYQDWTSGRLPRVIIVMPLHPNPYFDDSYAVNSANLGPYGDAIMRELLPEIERRFRGIGQGWARAVFGGSTGGWEALAQQVFYPDEINGAWVGCPDPIDFRAYATVNIYTDPNAYFRRGPFLEVPMPEKRFTNGRLDSTMEQENLHELVEGTHSRSGEQFDVWQAVFGPMGEDGYPKPIWDKRTGDIDKSVAAYWREHSDLTFIMKRDWATLGPKLAGKLHFAAGEVDTWYLNNSVRLARKVLSDPALMPPANASFDLAPGQPHCYQGVALDAPRWQRLNWFGDTVVKMVRHMEATAPAGADRKSWKY